MCSIFWSAEATHLLCRFIKIVGGSLFIKQVRVLKSFIIYKNKFDVFVYLKHHLSYFLNIESFTY